MQSVSRKLNQNQKAKNRLQSSYEKKSIFILKRRKKSAQKLVKKVFKMYNIITFQQYNRNLALISNASASKKLVYDPNLDIVNIPNQVIFFSQILSGCISSKFKQEISKKQCIDIL